ncbi:MAG: ABC transporter permease subunit [Gemmataceae bacterium]|nr:ABC transporter permease subunit [Gemmata sp.]MDW8196781.1 ABC transporter permease subunit [Gemmataceae bacterium]
MIRRGTVVWGGLLVLGFQVLVLLVFAAYWFSPRSPEEVFRFGWLRVLPEEACAFTTAATVVLLEVQLAIVVTMAPALAVTALAEEKDRQTLPLLLLTEWTEEDIVGGKAVARAAILLITLGGSFPLWLGLWGLGPLDWAVVAAGWLLTVGTTVCCIALGIYAACCTDDFRSAVLQAYVLVAVVVGGALVPPGVRVSPFAVVASLPAGDGGWWWAWCYPFVQIVVAGVVLKIAARRLRRGEAGAGPLVSAYPLPPRPAYPILITPRRRHREPLPPLDARNPLLWKERCLRRPLPWLAPPVWHGMATMMVAAIALLSVGGAWLVFHRVERVWREPPMMVASEQGRIPDHGGWLLTGAGVLAAGCYLFPVAVGISAAVAGERERRTLEPLLAAAFSRRSILRAKVQAQIERGVGFAAVAVTAVGMAFTADHGIRLGVATAVMVMVGMALVMAVGAWLTIRCPQEWRALRFLLPVTLLAVMWPLGVKAVLHNRPDVSAEGVFRGLIVVAGAALVATSLLWWWAERTMDHGDGC